MVDGPYEHYHDNGQLNRKGTFKNGEHDGPYEIYHDNGQLAQKITFKNGVRYGPTDLYPPPKT